MTLEQACKKLLINLFVLVIFCVSAKTISRRINNPEFKNYIKL